MQNTALLVGYFTIIQTELSADTDNLTEQEGRSMWWRNDMHLAVSPMMQLYSPVLLYIYIYNPKQLQKKK